MVGENGDLTDKLSDQAIIKFCVIKSDIKPAAEEYFIGELIFQCPDDSDDTGSRIMQGFSCGTVALAICDSENDLTQISFTPKLRIVRYSEHLMYEQQLTVQNEYLNRMDI